MSPDQTNTAEAVERINYEMAKGARLWEDNPASGDGDDDFPCVIIREADANVVLAEFTRLRSRIMELEKAGAPLATLAFNLAQRGSPLTEAQKATCRESYEAWDAARVLTEGVKHG